MIQNLIQNVSSTGAAGIRYADIDDKLTSIFPAVRPDESRARSRAPSRGTVMAAQKSGFDRAAIAREKRVRN
jgi:hypothetical protein